MAAKDKTIALFGATGSVGSVFLEVALNAGWHIRALCRTPSKLKMQHQNLSVIQGGFDDIDKLEECITGAAYVVNTAGAISGVSVYPTDLNLNLVKQLRPMMAKAGTSVFLHNAGGLAFLEGESRPCMARMVRCIGGCCVKTLEPALQDHEMVYKYMISSGMLKDEPYGVIVPRPMAFGTGPSKGKLKKKEAGGMGTESVDVAAFYLEALTDKSLFGTFPYMDY